MHPRGKVTSRDETGHGLSLALVSSGEASRRQLLEHVPARKTADNGHADGWKLTPWCRDTPAFPPRLLDGLGRYHRPAFSYDF